MLLGVMQLKSVANVRAIRMKVKITKAKAKRADRNKLCQCMRTCTQLVRYLHPTLTVGVEIDTRILNLRLSIFERQLTFDFSK